MTDPQIFSLYKISFFFRSEELIKQIDIAQKLEIMAISLISYLSIDMDKSLNVPVKNLLFFVHQNCLLIIKLVLNRLPPEALNNSWAKKLQTAADTKLSK